MQRIKTMKTFRLLLMTTLWHHNTRLSLIDYGTYQIDDSIETPTNISW